MAWYCNGCGEERHGTTCKKRCREKYGDMGAERVPRLDGMLFMNDDGSGITRWEQRRYDNMMCKGDKYPRSVQGLRPQGWHQALEVMGERAAPLLVGGLPEC